MFRKLLIANRGEIACRIVATARRLGIATVAVHSDADAEAAHVRLADEAVRIGPAPVAESYLSGDAILSAARATGAEAVHPGYGFLSENPAFAEAVEAAGLAFVGPPADAMRAMGLKDAAKSAMEAVGVPVVPGYHGSDQSPERLVGEAERIGYPVLIKARAGGGGKGMRRVDRPGDFAAALEGARAEGASSFGDPACLIERYVASPRHVEIQVFADAHGNVVHLFERDCSLQRRHQKVIEEAPAPGMTAAVRAAMGRAAVEAARAIGYRGAGTVEFIADGAEGLREDGFWFMEMNTRLQVEHPVTEAITGYDLVALQLRVAAGEPLPFAQEDLAIDGHAVEARLYAEDPGRGFLPATGRLAHLAFPEARAFAPAPVRIDSGVRAGDEVTPWYDPMIAKVIAHGSTRTAALNRLAGALASCEVAGCTTNLEFLGRLVRHPDFEAGHVDTGLIERELAALTAEAPPPEPVTAVAALEALGLLARPGGHDPWDRLAGWRHWSEASQYATLEYDGVRIDRRVVALDGGRFRVEDDAGQTALEVVDRGERRFDVVIAGRRQRMTVVRTGATVTVFAGGRAHGYALPDLLSEAEEGEAGGDAVSAPMPGIVRRVSASEGDAVRRGDALMVLEAMKMEHTLSAPRDGTVAEVLVAAGDSVSDGDLLLRLAEGEA